MEAFLAVELLATTALEGVLKDLMAVFTVQSVLFFQVQLVQVSHSLLLYHSSALLDKRG